MGSVDKSESMMNSYSVSKCPLKWTKKLFLHLLEFTIPNSIMNPTCCGSELSHGLFRLTFLRDLIQEMGRVRLTQAMKQEQAPFISRLKRLDTGRNKHWLLEGAVTGCRVCPAKTKQRELNLSVQHAMLGCVLPCVSRCITPNCISDYQLAPNWTGRVHRHM
jgi:hypothetical protein